MSTAIHTRVFIVEDSPSIRDRLAEMLGDLDGVAVVGDAETPGDAIAGILRTHPDYVVLDYQLDGGTAVDVLRAVQPRTPETVFLVLTNHPNPQYRRICLEAGASFFFDKSLEFGKVRDVVAAAAPLQH
jgi:DNA-binding NarL/FixJ family response regulator